MKTKPNPKSRQENLIRALLITLHFTAVLCRPPSYAAISPNSTHKHPHSSISPSGYKTFHTIHSQDLKTDTMAKFGEKTKINSSQSIHHARGDKLANLHTPLDNTIDLRAVSLNRYNYDIHPIDVDNDVFDHSEVDGDPYVSVGGSLLVDENSIILNSDYEKSTHGDVYHDVSEDTTVLLERTHAISTDVIDDFEEDTTILFERPQTLMDANEEASPIDELSRLPLNRNHGRKRRHGSSPNPDHHWRRRRRRQHRLLLKTRGKNHLTNSQDITLRRRDRFLLKSDGPGHVIFKADEVKKDWCRTIPFEQNVTAGRCSKVVKNNLCYGQCNSFFIPQSGKSSNKVAFQSCSFCKPHRLRWVNVTLSCPGRHPPKLQKTILKVEACRCIAADRNEMNKNLEYLRKGSKNVHTNQ